MGLGHEGQLPVRGAGGSGAAWYSPSGERLVAVPQLLAQLDAAAPLTLVRAPAGFGKTTLVRLWTASRQPGAAVELVDDLDDLTEERVDELVARARAGGVRLVVCARAGLTGDSARARALDRLAEHAHCVDGAALRLADEVVIDLWTGLGLARHADRLEELAEMVGGWVQLATEAGAALVASGGDPPEVATRVAGELLAGWVADELIDEERALLRALVRPARLTVGTAALVLARPDEEVVAVLERLERFGYLAGEPVDGATEFRWPTAVRDALRDLLATDHDAEVDAALARWHVVRREPDVALTHVLAAGSEAVAREVLGRAWLPLLVYRHDDLVRFFRAAPSGWFADPDDFPHGVRQLAMLPVGEAGDWAWRAPDLEPHLSRDPRTALNQALVQLFGLRRARRVEEAVAAAQRLCALADEARATNPAEVEDLLASIFLLTGLMHELAGDVSGTLEPLRWSTETADVSGNAGSARHASAHLAMNLALLGRLDEAEHWLAVAATAPATSGWVSPRARIAVWVAEVLVAVGRGDQDAARLALRGLLTVRDPLDELWPFVLYARARYARHWGGRRAEVERLLARPSTPPGSELDRLLQAARADLAS